MNVSNAPNWNSVSFTAMLQGKAPYDHCIQTNASGHWGYRACFGSQWLQHAWSCDHIIQLIKDALPKETSSYSNEQLVAWPCFASYELGNSPFQRRMVLINLLSGSSLILQLIIVIIQLLRITQRGVKVTTNRSIFLTYKATTSGPCQAIYKPSCSLGHNLYYLLFMNWSLLALSTWYQLNQCTLIHTNTIILGWE